MSIKRFDASIRGHPSEVSNQSRHWEVGEESFVPNLLPPKQKLVSGPVKGVRLVDLEIEEGEIKELLGTLREIWENNDSKWVCDTVDEVMHAIRQLLRERDEARETIRALEAWQCPFVDGTTGLTSDEHGNQFCAMEARVKEWEKENQGLLNELDAWVKGQKKVYP